MSTHLPGFKSFFMILYNFVLAKLATSSIRVNNLMTLSFLEGYVGQKSLRANCISVEKPELCTIHLLYTALLEGICA